MRDILAVIVVCTYSMHACAQRWALYKRLPQGREQIEISVSPFPPAQVRVLVGKILTFSL